MKDNGKFCYKIPAEHKVITNYYIEAKDEEEALTMLKILPYQKLDERVVNWPYDYDFDGQEMVMDSWIVHEDKCEMVVREPERDMLREEYLEHLDPEASRWIKFKRFLRDIQLIK